MRPDIQKQVATRQQIREKAEAAARNYLQSVEDYGIAQLFPFVTIHALRDDRCCDICRSFHGRIIRASECTIEMLPPFHDCQNKEDGCRCLFVQIDQREAAKRGLQ